MNTDTTAMARPTLAQAAEAALHATTSQAKAENLAAIAQLTPSLHGSHLADHIQGMVAATMGHLSADASGITRDNAEHWQKWALGVADGVAHTVAAAV